MRKRSKKLFQFVPFSGKQLRVLTWWHENSPVCDRDGIISDGSVRAGKTIIMSLSYVLWGMATFNEESFGMAGKTIGSFRRNVLIMLKIMLVVMGYHVHDHRSDNMLTISKGNVTNYFYIFGGNNERSQDLVAGFTAAGFFFDETTLQPESFVNQAIARCSVEGSKVWFNCNPDSPYHWFKTSFIDNLDQKNLIRVKFQLDDNPSLSESKKAMYRRMFSGVFYDRYILGLWVMAEGIIYSMFNHNTMVLKKVPSMVKMVHKWVGIDYGQSNATTFILCGLGSDNKLYILDEYYHEGRTSQIQKSPAACAKELRKWLLKNGMEGYFVNYRNIFCDPSAKGFMLQLHEEGIKGVRQANNEVVKGIELLSSIMQNDMFRVLAHCKHVLEELGAYSWDPKGQERGEDKPVKQHDHCLDAIRYVTNSTRQTWQRLNVVMERSVVKQAISDMQKAA